MWERTVKCSSWRPSSEDFSIAHYASLDADARLRCFGRSNSPALILVIAVGRMPVDSGGEFSASPFTNLAAVDAGRWFDSIQGVFIPGKGSGWHMRRAPTPCRTLRAVKNRKGQSTGTRLTPRQANITACGNEHILRCRLIKHDHIPPTQSHTGLQPFRFTSTHHGQTPPKVLHHPLHGLPTD